MHPYSQNKLQHLAVVQEGFTAGHLHIYVYAYSFSACAWEYSFILKQSFSSYSTSRLKCYSSDHLWQCLQLVAIHVIMTNIQIKRIIGKVLHIYQLPMYPLLLVNSIHTHSRLWAFQYFVLQRHTILDAMQLSGVTMRSCMEKYQKECTHQSAAFCQNRVKMSPNIGEESLCCNMQLSSDIFLQAYPNIWAYPKNLKSVKYQ